MSAPCNLMYSMYSGDNFTTFWTFMNNIFNVVDAKRNQAATKHASKKQTTKTKRVNHSPSFVLSFGCDLKGNNSKNFEF